MKYKGYQAAVQYDADDNIFVGSVRNTEDSLSFHGKTIKETEKNFQNCIDNYEAICKKIGKLK